MLSELRAYLISVPEVTALVGTRIYPTVLPQAPTFPSVTYQVISATRQPTMLTPDGMPAKRVQIDAWGLSFGQAFETADAIRVALDGVRGVLGDSPGVEFGGVFAEQERGGYESDPKLHRYSRDYIVWARE